MDNEVIKSRREKIRNRYKVPRHKSCCDHGFDSCNREFVEPLVEALRFYTQGKHVKSGGRITDYKRLFDKDNMPLNMEHGQHARETLKRLGFL